MIHSMTGFGSSACAIGGLALEVEARSVNHRHLDLRIRLPRVLADQETRLKKRVQAALSRGKVDITVSLVMGSAESTLEIDEAIAAHYVEASRNLRERHGLSGELDVSSLLSLPGVTRLIETEIDPATILEPLEGAIDEAVAALVAMRAAEGATLAAEFEDRLRHVAELTERFGARSGEVVEVAKQRLRRRAEQIKREVGILDEARLHQEVVIAADRLDITEELVRLRSHVDQFRETLASAGSDAPVGRRLDFLLQELGREANTVGSKASDAPLAQDVVELKTELERIREQVQNVE
ncbi:MAG: YicC family protein [bacterium]|nr:YicC family protein [bacterium]